MITEYNGVLEDGMIAYVLPDKERRISRYRDIFSFGPDTYTERINMVSKLNQIKYNRSVTKDSFYLKVSYGGHTNYTYTQADCFIFGHIALHGSTKEEINFIAKLIETLGNKDIKNWCYDCHRYSLDGKYAGSETTLKSQGYTIYEVKDFYKFCKNNNIILPINLNYLDDEIELQREESSERGGNVSGDVGICIRRCRIEFTLGHLSNKAQCL